MTQTSPRQISVANLLEVVWGFEMFGGASPGLVAWELCLEERDVMPAWEQARRSRLLRKGELDREFGEQLYKLSAIGQTRLRTLALG